MDLHGEGGAKLKLRTAGTSKQLHEFSRKQLLALALVAVVTASITMAGGGVDDQQFLLSTQPRPRSAATGIMVRGIGRVKNVTSAQPG